MSHRTLRFALALTLSLSLGHAVFAAGPEGTAPLPDARLVGQRVGNFTAKQPDGKPFTLYDLKGKTAVVLAFLGTDCPVGNLYAPRLAELSLAFKEKGAAFVGVYSNAHDTPEQIAAHVKEFGITFPVIKDEENLIADTLLVERTCEVVVLDGLGFVRYRGAIDDQYGVGTRKESATHNYLKDAVADVVTSGRIDVKATPVVGCLIDRVAPKSSSRTIGSASRVRPAPEAIADFFKEKDAAEEAKIGNVTYSADVAPIIQNKCQSCHRPGEVGPFPLSTYDDARKHAAMIGEVVGDRRMPPWHADPRYGHFQNDRSLNPKERATLLAWIEQGTPLGDAAKLTAAREYPEGWTIGKPDMVFEIPEPFVVPAQGTVEYVHIRVPTKLKEDVWVQAAEARPQDRSVVHHIIIYLDDHKAVRGGLGQEDGHLCGYAPGDMPSIYPEGSAKKIPAGSDLIFEIHYTPIGKIRTDRPKVGFILAKKPVEHEAHTMAVAFGKFEIPAGDPSYPVESTFTFPRDAHLLSFMPHMHLRGKSFRYEAVFPDGKKETLLNVPAYDFGWQSYYTLAEPMAMPKGTVINCFAQFDNSDKNPYNPDPSKPVRWGDQTWQEMMIGYIDYVDDAPPSVKAKLDQANAANQPSRAGQVFKMLGRSAKRKQQAPKPAQ